jgi:hypothetical protein
MNDDAARLLDRLVALAPLGVLVFVLRRLEGERGRLLDALEHDRAAFRDERRELINRIQFPTLAPVATRPASTPPVASGDAAAAAERRRQWASVGRVDRTAATPDLAGLPGDGDDLP